jgi:hypothetical protein
MQFQENQDSLQLEIPIEKGEFHEKKAIPRESEAGFHEIVFAAKLRTNSNIF